MLLGLVACTHQRSMTSIHQASGEWVTVETPHGDQEAFVVRHPTGVLFRREDGRIVDPSSVMRVTHRQPGRGAVEGIAFGLVIGAVGGATLGYVTTEDNRSDFCILFCSKSEGATLFGIAFGMTGGVIGGIIGAVRGSRLIYEARTTSAVKWHGPAGSTVGMTVSF